jgi:hypothetical protein
MARPETIPTLTSELAVEILNKTLEELQTPQNVKKIGRGERQRRQRNVENDAVSVPNHHASANGRDKRIRLSERARRHNKVHADVAKSREGRCGSGPTERSDQSVLFTVGVGQRFERVSSGRAHE